MLLSIIIPLYNSEKYISNCIGSLLRQGLSDEEFEIIIVNDGSVDGGVAIVEDYQKKHNNIKLYHQENSGPAITRNKGLDCATGKYVYFIDSDDYLINNALVQLLKYAEEHDLDILSFLTKSVQKNVPEQKEFKPEALPDKPEIMNGIEFLEQVNYRNEVWWFIAKRSFLVGTGVRFPEGEWMEDITFTLDVILSAQRAAFVPIEVHRYFEAPASVTNDTTKEHFENMIWATERVIFEFQERIEMLQEEQAPAGTIRRVRNRQESLLFFLLIRFFKSELTYSQLKDLLRRMRGLGVYPFKYFYGVEYQGLKYKMLITLFNNPGLLKTSFKIYRMFR